MGHCHTLLLSSRKFGGLMLHPVGQAEKIENLFGFLFGYGTFGLSDQSRDHHILESRKLGEQLMKLEDEANILIAERGQFFLFHFQNIGAVDHDAARIGLIERAHNLEKRSFAGAALSDDRNDFALTDGQIDAFEDTEVAETFGDIGYFNHAFGMNR